MQCCKKLILTSKWTCHMADRRVYCLISRKHVRLEGGSSFNERAKHVENHAHCLMTTPLNLGSRLIERVISCAWHAGCGWWLGWEDLQRSGGTTPPRFAPARLVSIFFIVSQTLTILIVFYRLVQACWSLPSNLTSVIWSSLKCWLLKNHSSKSKSFFTTLTGTSPSLSPK